MAGLSQAVADRKALNIRSSLKPVIIRVIRRAESKETNPTLGSNDSTTCVNYECSNPLLPRQ